MASPLPNPQIFGDGVARPFSRSNDMIDMISKIPFKASWTPPMILQPVRLLVQQKYFLTSAILKYNELMRATHLSRLLTRPRTWEKLWL